MNKALLLINLLFCPISTLYHVSEATAKVSASSEQVEINAFSCTYNSETKKYDCVVEGTNNTGSYMFLSSLTMNIGSNSYKPIRDDSVFFTYSLVKPDDLFKVKYQTIQYVQQEEATFEPAIFGGTLVDELVFVKDIDYTAHFFDYDYSSSIYSCRFDLQFSGNLKTKRNKDGVDYIIYYSMMSLVKYSDDYYYIYCRYDYHRNNTIITSVFYDKEINADEIEFENVLVYEIGEQMITNSSGLLGGAELFIKLVIGVFVAIAAIGIVIGSIFGFRFLIKTRKKKSLEN
ncbi:MAG: hypothetical protein J5955_04940 [Bacilli bacterium]|nr:hypothetical protein [Bacilli bacterium]